MSNSARRVRYAVVGAGNIVQVAVLPAFQHARENSELVAVISGDPAKRSALRERYSLEADGDYGELEDILERTRADAVYIATPNSLHREYAVRAAARGVHVLCEKPLAPTVADCEAIAATCREHSVKMMIAYRLHFEAANLRALEIVRSGQLGRPRLFSSFFSHVVREGDIRLNGSLAGGAVYDLGVYCINAARNLFQAEPVSVFAFAIHRGDTDDTTVATMKFPDSRIAQFSVSNSTADVSSYRIVGEKGDLRLEPAFEYAGENVHYLTVDGKTKREAFGKRDQFAPELLYFSNCILEDKEPEPSADEGTRDIRVIEAMQKSIESGTQVALLPLAERRARPSMDQEMKKPAVGKQKPVNAPGPSAR
ncbi:MAG TPA: Gfo/Idh/MocA family oxidoreductase [Polyangiaceae bacterium]|jgi:predicted dehydrogenase|nr:Gfo/Idh/MocA family oxidoreductase [Polyangiaceae bacterium]